MTPSQNPLSYNKKVMQHFTHPKNMGEIKNPSGIGEVGNMKCLLPGEKIFLNSEFKEIEKSKKKDIVISHDATRNKIIEKFSRNYKDKIITLQNAIGKINLTNDHLVYAIILPNHSKYLRNKNKRTLTPSWYHANHLKKGDITLYPIEREEIDLKYISINIPKLKYDYNSKKLPDKVPLNNDLLKLFGYFLSEGTAIIKPTRAQIIFSFNIKEKNLANNVKKISKKLFGIDAKFHTQEKNNVLKVHLFSSRLARFFRELFGHGTQNKKIPEFIMQLPIKKQKYLIEGLWNGDGYVNTKRIGPRAGYVTISYQLAQQIKTLLLRQKIIPSIYQETGRQSKWANHKKAYRIHVGQKNSLEKLCKILKLKYCSSAYTAISSWIKNKYLYTPITKIETRKYNGKVYNLEVDKKNSFISEAFTIHNCGDIMKLTIKVKENKITDIKFKTFGCAAAIASTSMLTEIAKGKTIQEAKKLQMKDVATALGGLPNIKLHCSSMAIQALHKAILNYEETIKHLIKPNDK